MFDIQGYDDILVELFCFCRWWRVKSRVAARGDPYFERHWSEITQLLRLYTVRLLYNTTVYNGLIQSIHRNVLRKKIIKKKLNKNFFVVCDVDEIFGVDKSVFSN